MNRRPVTEYRLWSIYEYAVSRGILTYVGLATVFYLVLILIPMGEGDPAVRYADRFTYLYVLAVAGPILLDLLRRVHCWRIRYVLPLVMTACVLTTMMTLYYYRLNTSSQVYIENYEAYGELDSIDDQYRYASTDNALTMTGDAAGVGAFSSTMEMSSFRFSRLFDRDSSNSTESRWGVPGLVELLGGKYRATTDSNSDQIVAETSGDGKKLYVTEGSAFPIGFALDHYLYAKEIKSLPVEQRAYALMQAAVIYPAEEEQVSGLLEHVEASEINTTDPDINALIVQAEANAVQDFDRSSHGFTCTTHYDRDRMVYFTVPNDDGWTATIDGVEAEIVDSGGMMLLAVPAGDHRVIFTYNTPGLDIGTALSTMSWVLWALLVVATWRGWGSFGNVAGPTEGNVSDAVHQDVTVKEELG